MKRMNIEMRLKRCLYIKIISNNNNNYISNSSISSCKIFQEWNFSNKNSGWINNNVDPINSISQDEWY